MGAMEPFPDVDPDVQHGRKILEFDDSRGACTIPAGCWQMDDVVWAGYGPRPGVPRTRVSIEDGAQFANLRMIGGQITIVNNVTDGPSPVSDFIANGANHVQIGMRDDCGNTQIVNPGTVPMFDLGANLAIFFVQNCLFGMPIPPTVIQLQEKIKSGQEVVREFVIPGIASNPLIHQSAGSILTLNLLGQNQTGPNLVSSDPGVPGVSAAPVVLFGALSSAAQVAYDQSKSGLFAPDPSSVGTTQFGPQGRIQRDVLPLHPAPPIKASLAFNKPNVLIRCDGTGTGFTQILPAIAGGFTIGNTQIPLYSGGQEVVVAEVMGGTGLKVSPATGDTIDGQPGPKTIAKNGSRTFISDGYNNWITISMV
jgi:hypothetical protein